MSGFYRKPVNTANVCACHGGYRVCLFYDIPDQRIVNMERYMMDGNQIWKPRLPGQLLEHLTGLAPIFPEKSAKSSLLRQQIKDVRWLQPNPRASFYRMIAVRAICFLGVVILMLRLDFDTLQKRILSPRNYDYWHFPTERAVLGACIVAIGLTLVANFWYLFRGLRAGSLYFKERDADIFPKSAMSSKTLIQPIYGATKLRVWRILSVEMLPRFYIGFGLLQWFIFTLYTSFLFQPWPDAGGNYGQYRKLVFEIRPEQILDCIVLVLGMILFALEAGWRMRAITAVGLSLWARFRSTAGGFVAGVFVIIGVHIVQALLLWGFASIVIYGLTGRLYQSIFRPNVFSYSLTVAGLIATLAALNYTWLRLIRWLALRDAARRIAEER
jgi:hypothetical protein